VVKLRDARQAGSAFPSLHEKVALIVTSPPYFALRSYQDGGEHYDGQIGSEPTPTEFLDALIACTADWLKVLRDDASIWVNLGDKYSGAGGPGGDYTRTIDAPKPAPKGGTEGGVR
jgi:DNA modification methylase